MDERLKLVIKSFDNNTNFSKLCHDFGVSTKTGYKWKERFLQGGAPALEDQPRRPLANSKSVPTELVCQIIRIKTTKKSWGPKKIFAILNNRYPDRDIPSESTIGRILDKAGLVKKKRIRNLTKTERIKNRINSTAPNQIWTVDFKGWWYTTLNEKCEPLTIRDDFSKFVLSIKILEKGNISSVKAEFERIFKIYGLPDVIRSDNGPPFASVNAHFGLTKLAAWWLSLGIRLDRIDPGKPYQNGAHERMHLDMMKELEGKISGDLKLHQSIFNIWRDEFNKERPHEALAMNTPSSVYVKSSRKYKVIDEIAYPKNYISRVVNSKGYTQYKGRRIFLSNAFNGFNVGIDDSVKSQIKVWLANNFLGEIDRGTFLFTPNEAIVTV